MGTRGEAMFERKVSLGNLISIGAILLAAGGGWATIGANAEGVKSNKGKIERLQEEQADLAKQAAVLAEQNKAIAEQLRQLNSYLMRERSRPAPPRYAPLDQP